MHIHTLKRGCEHVVNLNNDFQSKAEHMCKKYKTQTTVFSIGCRNQTNTEYYSDWIINASFVAE